MRVSKLVIGPEGSALAHAVLALPEGACILQICGPATFNMAFKLPCHAAGLDFGCTIADDGGNGGYIMPLDRLQRAIDLMPCV